MSVIRWALLALTAWQGKVLIGEEINRNQKYGEAEAFAKYRGKPFLVVGGPYGVSPLRHLFHFKAHGCGDLCLDIDARACQGCKMVVADIRDIPFSDKYFGAAFASHVIEHLPTESDAEQAVHELYRVADDVWIVSPSKQSIMAWLASGHHLWISQDHKGVFIEAR